MDSFYWLDLVGFSVVVDIDGFGLKAISYNNQWDFDNCLSHLRTCKGRGQANVPAPKFTFFRLSMLDMEAPFTSQPS